MSIKEIKDPILKKDIINFEKILEKMPEFKNIVFTRWSDRTLDRKLLLFVEITENGKNKIIKISQKHQKTIDSISIPLDGQYPNPREFKEDRDALFKDILSQISN